MSSSQAERFAREWRVVAQYSHSEAVPLLDEFNRPTGEFVLRSNGLVVTLFEEAGTGRQAVAVRGTERGDAADWTTNVIDIGILGTPERQAQYRSLVEKVGEWHGAGLLRDGFAVTGHSLGGFLASALAIEWAGRIAAAYVYNAPGLGGVTANEAVAERVWRALSPAGVVSGGAATPIYNLVAVGDPVGGLIGVPVAPPIRIHIEAGNPLHNHSIVTLTDALAVYALFATLDPALDASGSAGLRTITAILKGSSATANRTLETALDALRKLFDPAGTVATAIDTRESYYKHIDDLQHSQFFIQSAGLVTLRDLTPFNAPQIASIARNNLATRYALLNLNPFAVVGDDGPYARHNVNGALDLFDPATGEGALTAEYLADRAAMLTWLMQGNANDRGYGATTGGLNVQYLDLGSGQAAYALSTASAIDAARAAGADAGRLAALFRKELALNRGQRVVFGSESAEIINGGSKNDRLYGGGGDDVLNGGASLGVVVEGSKTRNGRNGKSQSLRGGGRRAADDWQWGIAA